MNKSWSAAAAAVGGMAVLAACGGGGSSATAAGDGSGSVKIGVVLPLTGVQAAIARTESLGAQVAAKQINDAGGAGGKFTIDLVQKDDQLSTAQSAAIVRQLKSEGVELAMGIQTTDLCKAMAQAAQPLGILVLGSHCSSHTLVEPPVTSDYWMSSAIDTDLTKAEGNFLAEKFPNIKTWDVFGYDQAVTRGFWTQTAAQMSAKLGRPVQAGQEAYVPVGTTDYRTQLSAQVSGLKGSKQDRGLFLGVYGAGTTSYIQQARPLGLLDDYAAVAQIGVYWTTAKALKGTAPSIYDVHEYFWSCQQNAENDAFVKAYEALAGEKPDTGAYQGYISVKLLAAAVAKAGKTDSASVQKAMAGLSIDTPAGVKLTMDATSHHADGPITVAELVGDPAAPDGVALRSCKVMQASAL